MLSNVVIIGLDITSNSAREHQASAVISGTVIWFEFSVENPMGILNGSVE